MPDVARGLHSSHRETAGVMETRLTSLSSTRPRGPWSIPVRPTPARRAPARPARSSGWNVRISTVLKADARRIFQALTLPEYLEAWITMPDQEPESSIAVLGEAGGFRLVHSSENRVVSSIAAYFLLQKLRVLRFHWRSTRARVSVPGLVEVRIRDQFEGCVLELRHSALASAEEYLWHRKLWQNSLRKLAVLLRLD
jgi:uncharacterized protein YndB with AHSA1/START domain